MPPETEEKNHEPSATNRLKVNNAILEHNEPALATPAVQPASHSELFSGRNDIARIILLVKTQGTTTQ